MIEKKFVEEKKQEFEIKEFIKAKIGKGKVAEVKIERTPIGEKIVISTTKPGLVIGHGGEIIQDINKTVKERFKLENPQIEVSEIVDPMFDAQTVADNLALALENLGPMAFKLIAYRELEKIIQAGALGAEIRLSGRLPSERAKSWRFAFGYLRKTGENQGVVNKAKAVAFTQPGVVGVKVSIVPKNVRIPDKITIKYDQIEKELKEKIINEEQKIEEVKKEEIKIEKKERKSKKKTEK
ncbi:MAG: 30S ribosomal protein S3 [Candidatus Pacearchaeota archaeon]|nr:30S ribosomal protein S3 [Candidatus Pacearchaeota archaeon]